MHRLQAVVLFDHDFAAFLSLAHLNNIIAKTSEITHEKADLGYNGPMLKSRRYELFCFLFLFLSVSLYSSQLVPTQEQKAEAESMAGVWTQYMVTERGEKFMGTFRLVGEGPDFTVEPIYIPPDCYPQVRFMSVNHSVRGDRWVYTEEWGPNDQGTFELTRQADGTWVGPVTPNGQWSSTFTARLVRR